jgi:protein-S-isoprenylcysteine O-methyltransferase Ste14
MDAVAILLLVAYASLLLELVVFPIPSEASTYQLLFEAREPDPGADALSRARRRSPLTKLLLYFLPTFLGVLAFLIPLAALAFPALVDSLVPIDALRNPAVRWSGAGLVLAGRLFTFVSVLQLRRMRRAGTGRASGLFLVSRNPGLLGMYAFYLGLCLIFPCAVLFACFVPYVLNMHNRILMEEGQLARNMGAEWRDYAARVPRYLFFGTKG